MSGAVAHPVNFSARSKIDNVCFRRVCGSAPACVWEDVYSYEIRMCVCVLHASGLDLIFAFFGPIFVRELEILPHLKFFSDFIWI